MPYKTVLLLLVAAYPLRADNHEQNALDLIASGENEGLKIAAAVSFTEGPAWHAPTSSVYFTDIPNERIMRYDAQGNLETFRTRSGRANGLVFDNQNRLLACEGGNRCITRTEPNGARLVLADNYKGNRFNSPNDIIVDSQDRIYFTDPRYGNRDNMEILAADGSAVEGVYRIDPDGSVHQVLELELHRPNGIALSQDETRLFVADNASGRDQGNRILWRFDRNPDGSVDRSSQTALFDWGNSGSDRGPDGMAVGKDDLLYVTAGLNFSDKPIMANRKFRSGIYVIDPDGAGLVRFIPIPIDDITNCIFGGPNGNTLYITAGHRLFSIEID